MRCKLRNGLAAILVGASLAAPASALGPREEPTEPRPERSPETPFNNTGPHLPPILDFFLLRPPAVIATVGGVAVWMICAPFNAVAGVDELKESARILIVSPGRYAFVDRLGSH